MKYGILKSITNTGLDSEIASAFVAPMALISNKPAYAQDTLSLKRNAASQNVQRWEIETNLMPSNDTAELFIQNILAGHDSRVYVRMPQIYGIGYSSGTITVNGDVAANLDTFNISGAANLIKGEFIQFTGDPKVYVVKEPGSAGVGVKIEPKLRLAVADLTAIILGPKVTMHALYHTDTRLGITYVDGILSDHGTVRLIEDL